jgi:hypothetical protein
MIAGGSDTQEKYHDHSQQNPFPRLGVPKSCQHPPVTHPTTATSLSVCREPGCREGPGFITVSAYDIQAVIEAPAGRGYQGTLNHRLFPQRYPILAALASVKIINNLSFTRYPRPAGVHRRPGWAQADGHFQEMGAGGFRISDGEHVIARSQSSYQSSLSPLTTPLPEPYAFRPLGVSAVPL